MSIKSTDLTRQQWIDRFVAYVIGKEPTASAKLLADKAARLYPILGEYGPIEVAEAEWEELHFAWTMGVN
jgi:hypothetical protein